MAGSEFDHIEDLEDPKEILVCERVREARLIYVI